MPNVRAKAAALKKFQLLSLTGAFDGAGEIIAATKTKLDQEFSNELRLIQEKVVQAGQVKHDHYAFDRAVFDYMATKMARVKIHDTWIKLPDHLAQVVINKIEGIYTALNDDEIASNKAEFISYLESGFRFRIAGTRYNNGQIEDAIKEIVRNS